MALQRERVLIPGKHHSVKISASKDHLVDFALGEVRMTWMAMTRMHDEACILWRS